MKPIIEVVPQAVKADELFPCFLEDPYPFFLDSGIENERLARYSFIGSEPFLVFSSKGDNCFVSHFYDNQNTLHLRGNPLRRLQEIMEKYIAPGSSPVEAPFTTGGAVGYLAYDLGRRLLDLPELAADDLELPESHFAFYDSAVVIDHLEKQTYMISTGLPYSGKEAERHCRERFQRLRSRMDSYLNNGSVPDRNGTAYKNLGRNLRSNYDRGGYLKAVNKILDYISAGEISQINLSQRMEAELLGSPWELYRRLRRVNPAPFAAYLDFPPVTVVSSSPERYLRLQGHTVEARPIKGTRPRGKTAAEDRKMQDELWNSTKERTELALVAELEKEELSKVCLDGTVNIDELYRLESYATVHHLVSTITGRLPEGKDLFDLLQITFPGSSISGTPRVRSMEIIEEMEPCRRGIYTGSLGYMDFAGRADLNVVIRTFIIKDGKAYFQVGGGLVAASQPEDEYQETLDKARALLEALGLKH